MRYRKVTGLRLSPSVICLGTAMYGSAISEAESLKMLDTYFDLGGNFLDTALIYADWIPDGNGKSEKTLGKWLSNRGLRNKIIVSTKGGHPHLDRMDESRMSLTEIKKDLSTSLERLKTDYIDLYWFHRDDPNLPVSSIVEIANELIQSKQVLSVGASNWTIERLLEAQNYCQRNGLRGFCASQLGWSLADIQNSGQIDPSRVYMNDQLLEQYRGISMPVMAYSSQAAGFFSKEPLRRAGVKSFSRYDELITHYYTSANFKKYDRAVKLAKKYQCSPNSIALSYICSQLWPSFAIIGARNSEQVKTSCSAADLELTENEIRFLEVGMIGNLRHSYSRIREKLLGSLSSSNLR